MLGGSFVPPQVLRYFSTRRRYASHSDSLGSRRVHKCGGGSGDATCVYVNRHEAVLTHSCMYARGIPARSPEQGHRILLGDLHSGPPVVGGEEDELQRRFLRMPAGTRATALAEGYYWLSGSLPLSSRKISQDHAVCIRFLLPQKSPLKTSGPSLPVMVLLQGLP